MVVRPAGLQEVVPVLPAQLVDGFQAVADKTGSGDQNLLDPLGRQCWQEVGRGRFQPLVRPKLGLVGLEIRYFLFIQAQLVHQAVGGQPATFGIGVALFLVALGDAVIGKDDAVRPVLVDASLDFFSQSLDIGRKIRKIFYQMNRRRGLAVQVEPVDVIVDGANRRRGILGGKEG